MRQDAKGLSFKKVITVSGVNFPARYQCPNFVYTADNTFKIVSLPGFRKISEY